jgi:N-acyl-D-amino-acid deacylase
VFDMKIIGGTVVDGTGAGRYRADIGIKDGLILDIVRRGAKDPERRG